jgi:hypothetical protein
LRSGQVGRATDPITFAAILILLEVVALAASYITARRAMRVEPMVALRYEQWLSYALFPSGRFPEIIFSKFCRCQISFSQVNKIGKWATLIQGGAGTWAHEGGNYA